MRRNLVSFCGFVLLGAAMLLAQVPTGGMQGTVMDESGAVIPGAEITITNSNTALVRNVITGPTGLYEADLLPAGTYEVEVKMPGFQTQKRVVTVITGSSTRADCTLKVGTAEQVVIVEGAAPRLSYESHKIDGVVQRVQIENLPLNGRNFLQLAFLEPGVTVSTGSLAQYNAQFHVSVLGGSSSQTRITVDGANIVNAIEGGTQQNFSQEVVQEFQISSVNFDLSTGITGVGAVNIITRSGSNDFHGSAYFFFRDNHMAAYPELGRNPFNPDPAFGRRQSGFYVGGPIKRDKLLFFFNLEHINQDAVVPARLLEPEFAKFSGIFNNPYTGKQLTGRLDALLNQSHSLFFRYSHDGNDGFGPRGGAPLPSNWLANVNWADQGVLSLTSVFNPTLVNQFRSSYTYWHNRNLFPTPDLCRNCLGLGFPQISVVGTALTIGNTTNAPQGRDLRRYIFSDDVTWERGSHRVRFGGEWEYQRGTGFWAFLEPAAMVLWSPDIVRLYNSRVPAAAQILIPSTFNTIQDILQLPLAGFSTGIGDPSQPPPFQVERADHSNRLHLYWYDTWRIHSRFTLNFGLAWSYESNLLNHDLAKPDYLAPILGAGGLRPERHDPNNFSPALGFAWKASNDNKTVVRGGAGVYYGTMELWKRLIERAIIGPRGNGRFPIPGSFVPNPIPGLPGVPLGRPLSFTSLPTAFRGTHLMAILPAVRTNIQKLLGDPKNTDLSIRNIEVFKSGSDLLLREFTAPYTEHFNLGIQREIFRDLVVTADFVFRQSIHEDMGNVDYNRWDSVRGPVMPPCRSAAEFSNPKAVCSAGAISFRPTSGRSNYKALLLKANKRMSGRTQFLASYALASHNGFNGIVNNDDWFESFGPRGAHHILNVSGIIQLPKDFQVSFISVISTQGPFNASISGVDFNGDGTNNDRLPGSKQNQFNRSLGKQDLIQLVNNFNQTLAGKKTPRGQTIPTLVLPPRFAFGDNFYSQDLRLSKSFSFAESNKLTLMAEVFNLLNIANLGGFSGNLRNTALFGQPTSRVAQVFGSGGPRAFQLAVRLSF